jgi:hypothetical protein
MIDQEGGEVKGQYRRRNGNAVALPGSREDKVFMARLFKEIPVKGAGLYC